MKGIAIISFSFLMIGCEKPAPTPAPAFFVQVFYKTTTGEDLLNPQTQGAFDISDVDVFDIITEGNVITTRQSEINEVSICGGFVCSSAQTGTYSIQFFVIPTKLTTGAIIKVNPSASDTLTYQVVSAAPQSGYSVIKVSSKGQVLWSRTNTTAATITFVK